MKKVLTSESYQLAMNVSDTCCDDCASSIERPQNAFAGILIQCILSSTANIISVALLAYHTIHIMIYAHPR